MQGLGVAAGSGRGRPGQPDGPANDKGVSQLQDDTVGARPGQRQGRGP